MTNELKQLFETIQTRGLSIANFSRISGIPQDRIYKWRSGRGNPGAEDTDKIRQFLEGIPVDMSGRLDALDATVAVLLSEVASLRAQISGEHLEVVLQRLKKASSDLLSLRTGGRSSS